GLDALVFTAGIGEHAVPIRERVLRDAAWLGLTLDPAGNAAGGPRLTTAGSRVPAYVVPTHEELMIARHTRRLLAASWPYPATRTQGVSPPPLGKILPAGRQSSGGDTPEESAMQSFLACQDTLLRTPPGPPAQAVTEGTVLAGRFELRRFIARGG